MKYLVSPLVAVEGFSVGIGLLCVHLRVLDAIPIRDAEGGTVEPEADAPNVQSETQREQQLSIGINRLRVLIGDLRKQRVLFVSDFISIG